MRAAHRQPIRLTQKGKNWIEFAVVWGLTCGLGVFGAVLAALYYKV